MKQYQMGDIFKKISEKEDHIFINNIAYSPKTKFQIETVDGYKDVLTMITKEDYLADITTLIDDKEYKTFVSKQHRIKLANGRFEFVYNLKNGDKLENVNGKAIITNIKISNNKEIVYDITVDDNKSEYQDISGFTHHNTFGIKKVLSETLGEYGEGPRGKWAFYEGLTTTGFGLYKLLLLNKNKLIVFDDSDSIWKDKDMINMMKIVTSDSGDRTISWTSGATANVSLMSKEQREDYELEYIQEIIDDPNTKMKAPSSFNFSGQMINISNLPAGKFDNAIKSRAIFINVYLAQRDVLRRMATIKKLQGASDEKIKTLLTMLDPDAVDALSGKGKYAGEVKYVTPEIARQNKILNMRSLDIAEALLDAGVKNLEHMVSMYA